MGEYVKTAIRKFVALEERETEEGEGILIEEEGRITADIP